MDPVWEVTERTLRTECKVTGPITADSHFSRDLGLDSMALLTLAVAAEDHFRICLNENPEDPPLTVGAFVELVRARLTEAGHE